METAKPNLSSVAPVSPVPGETNWFEIVKRQVRALKSGAVQITVHEGRVTQVETSIRVRVDKIR